MAEDSTFRVPWTAEQYVEHHEQVHRTDKPIEECERVLCRIYVNDQKKEAADARED